MNTTNKGYTNRRILLQLIASNKLDTRGNNKNSTQYVWNPSGVKKPSNK